MTDPDVVEMLAAMPYRFDSGTPLDALLNRAIDRLPGPSTTNAGVDDEKGIEPRTVYVVSHDGTRLAVFLYGVQEGERRPVVWMHNRYNRGGISTEQSTNWDAMYPGRTADDTRGDVLLREPFCALVHAGYVFAVVDIRGTGSSFGSQVLPFSFEEALDAQAITRWLAAQDFCNGAVGIGVMFKYSGVNGATVVCLVLDIVEISIADVLASRSAKRCVGRTCVRRPTSILG